MRRITVSRFRSSFPAVALIVLSALFFAAVFLLTLRLGFNAAVGLDPSWSEVLGWGFIHHAMWGTQLIYSYGPLGFIAPGAMYVPGIFWPFITAQILLTAGLAYLCVRAILIRPLAGFLFVVLLAMWMGLVPGETSWLLTFLIGATVLINDLDDDPPIVWWFDLIVFATLVDAISLAKFASMLPLWIVTVPIVTLCAAMNHQYLRAAATFASLVLGVLAMWIATQGTLANFPAYLSTSWEVIVGYGQTMGTPASIGAEIVGGLLFCYFSLLLLFLLWKARRDAIAALSILLYGAGLFLAWRAYFTRGDHAPLFFVFMSFCAFPLLFNRHILLQGWTLTFTYSLPLGIALSGALLLGSASTGVYRSPLAASLAGPTAIVAAVESKIYDLSHLQELVTKRDSAWQQLSRSVDLPQMRKIVRNEPVDMVMSLQGIVLLNGFNYAPRPVYQSHVTYTPQLAQINERYFLGSAAPPFVILKLAAIDNHMQTQDDPLALIALLHRYRPRLVESGFLLLERDADAQTVPAVSPDHFANTMLGAEIPLPTPDNGGVIAYARVNLSFFGRLYSFLLREPALKITLLADDATRSENRFVRLTAPSGFLISPLLGSNKDWLNAYLGERSKKITSYRIEPEQSWQRIMFQDEIFVSAASIDLPHGAADPSLQSAMMLSLYPGFDPIPLHVAGITDTVSERGQPAFFMHAPASLSFHLEPGTYRASGEYGVRDEALAQAGCSGADGIGASIVLQHPGSDDKRIWHGEIDPFHHPADRGAQHFESKEFAIFDEDVLYAVDPGHGGSNTACDWSYVRNLKIVSVAH